MKENVSEEGAAAGAQTAGPVGDAAGRAAHLLRRLRAELRTTNSAVPAVPGFAAPEAGLLSWLREHAHPQLYTDDLEQSLAAVPGPLGLPAPRRAPDFLAALDVDELPVAALAPFLRAISLTGPDPTAAGLTPRALLDAPDPGHLVHIVGPTAGGPNDVPWPDPQDARHPGAPGEGLRFVVWTGITRERARSGDPVVASFLARATEDGVLLVNVDEVFHAGAPMLLHRHFRLELAKHTAPGEAAASRHLALEVLARFGGTWTASSMPAPRTGEAGFVIEVSGDGPEDLTPTRVVAPARHRVLRLWRELVRVHEINPQRELFGGPERMTGLGPGLPPEHRPGRHPEQYRAGLVLRRLLETLDLTPERSTITPAVPGRPAGLPIGSPAPDDVALARDLVAATLRRAADRDGDLHLTALAPVIEAASDPGALWSAVITQVAKLADSPGPGPVRSVTGARLDDEGIPVTVRLPAPVEQMLRHGPHGQGWLGARIAVNDGPVWLLGELVEPALLSPAALPAHDEEDEVSGSVRIPVERSQLVAGVSGQTSSSIVAGLVQMVQQHRTMPVAPLSTEVSDLDDDWGKGVLGWLRELLGSSVGESGHEHELIGQLGPDLFGFRRPEPAPAFLEGIDSRAVPADRVASFLDALSLTRLDGSFLAPAPEDLAPDRLAPGPVSALRPGGDWGVPDAPGLIPDSAVPHLVHGIWLGGPAPEHGLLRASFGSAAQHYADLVRFVVWTDLTRAEAARALSAPNPSGRAAGIVSMLEWAREQGISVVAVTEVFHADAPMRLWDQYVTDMVKLLPRGYSGASDRLRLEIMTRFGGAYVDGDNRFLLHDDRRTPPESETVQTLPEMFAAVAQSQLAFTPHSIPPDRINCDVIVAPARHPALLLWRELDRVACSLPQQQLFGTNELLQRRAGSSPDRLWLRYTVAQRVGTVHNSMLGLLGVAPGDPRLVPVLGAIRETSTRSWSGSDRPPRRVAATTGNITVRTASVIASLIRRMIARPGNLHLSAVAPVINAMADPDAVWVAVLRFFSLLGERHPALVTTSVTRFRWADDGSPDYLGLPGEAEAVLEPAPDAPQWFLKHTSVPGRPGWALDETVTPVRLLAPEQARGRSRGRRAAAGRAVVTSAGWLPPGFVGVTLTGRHGTAWALDGDGAEHRVTPEDIAVRLSGVGALTGPVLLRMSGGPEHGRSWFAARLSVLLNRQVVAAHAAGPAPAPAPVGSAGELRAREESARARRTRHGARLLADLERLAPLPPSPGPGSSPADGPEQDVPVSAAVREIQPWLRGLTTPRLHTTALEADLARQMGPDPYRRRARPARPAWLTMNPATLPVEGVAPFLRWLDLARLDPETAGTDPDGGELGVRLMLGATGPVSTVNRDRAARAWGQPAGAPLLPAEGAVPHLVHVVRLDGPVPEHDPLRARIGDAARQYLGRVEFVLWTDISRAEAAAALTGPVTGPDSQPTGRSARIRSMLAWARGNGVLVVPVAEVFHGQADLVLGEQIAAECARRTPLGHCVAAGYLRAEIVSLIGGAAVPDGHRFGSGTTLPGLFGEVAWSAAGFTVQELDEALDDGVIVAPAGHPALRLWRESARLRYLSDQPALYGGRHRMTERFRGVAAGPRRHPVARRAQGLHARLLESLDLDPGLLVPVAPAVECLPTPERYRETVPLPAGPDEIDPAERLVDIITVLSHELVARRGDLHLCEVASAVGVLPDPDGAWIAVLTRIAQLGAAERLPPVRSVTSYRWNELGELETVALPPEAQALIRSDADPDPGTWLGDGLNRPGQPVWLLDEMVEPARLRLPGAREPRERPAAVTPAPPADGEPLGLRYGEETDLGLQGVLPPGQTLVSARRWCGSPWGGSGRITPEQMAEDLIEAGLHERPVMIVTVPGSRNAGGTAEIGLGSFAAQLARLLGVLVTAVDAPLPESARVRWPGLGEPVR
ncbi:hypothetical protein [Kineosporia mesophila]|uniref:hypothetical protein n=1 Tax=Kineosporia mesophila TaxID=566012 RepID=UPI001E402394|nr:hypothetical protein [Kineosporia mesophila]MCD5348821.1 hypothetical protein [Kineosporia mesophila]